MKIYGLLNGLFYIVYGLYGAFFPKHLAAGLMGWTPDVLGLHQIRAIWMLSVGCGIVCLYTALKGNLTSLTKALAFVTLCLAAGRVLGLALDGTGPAQTYFEIGFEVSWSAIGIFLLSRAKQADRNLISE